MPEPESPPSASNGKPMQVVIVGCGRVGAELALTLCRQGRVTVVDQQAQAFDQLGPEFNGRTVQGEGFDPEVLRRAGIESAGALAAVTSSDSVNVVAARLAREMFHVPRVVARVYNPRRLPVYETFHIDTVVSTTWGAQRIAQMLIDPWLVSVFSAGAGEVQLVEVHVPEAWAGRAMDDLVPSDSGRVAAITRRGRAALPQAQMPLESGDRLLICLTQDGLRRLQERLGVEKESA